MVDQAKLDQMLTSLKSYAAVLKRLSSTPRSEFLTDHDKIGNAKYHFVIAIESCIDIANHVIASEAYRIPKSNADSFAVLIEEGILPEDRGNSYQAMAQFRNRLVHLYWNVEDERVYEYLQTCLGDFDSFASAIASRES
jgi:uncharacterized protein YutE (UPF0331/DUF86 family)